MIYGKDDVKRMLQWLKDEAEKKAFCYKNDNLPPKVIMLVQLDEIITELETKI